MSRLALPVLGLLILLPVWASRVLVTTDGPSHLYNAVLTEAAAHGRAPFATTFQVERASLRPNQASEFLLGALGRLVGWELGERVVLSAAMVANALVLLWLVGPGGRWLLAPGVAWLAHSWFAWMGFYDFALSIAWYGALVGLAARPLSERRSVLQLSILILLYFTHFFTFAVGTCVALAVWAWRAHRRQVPWSRLGVLAPAVLLLVVEVGWGQSAGGGALTWQAPWPAIAGLAVGDLVRSFHPLDAVGGVAIMATVWTTLFSRVRAMRRGAAEPLSGLEGVGLGLLALSVVAPFAVGVGGYIPIRLQMLGVVALLPSVGGAVPQFAAQPARWIATAVMAGFVVHAAQVVRIASRVNRDLLVIDGLLAQSGASAGAWVRARFTDSHRGLFRIGGYRHLVERLAVRRQLIVLDDYEALYGVFAVSWRARPDWVAVARPREDSLELRLVPGDSGWGDGVYLVYESDRRLGSTDPRLAVGPTLRAGGFAVARVRRRG